MREQTLRKLEVVEPVKVTGRDFPILETVTHKIHDFFYNICLQCHPKESHTLLNQLKSKGLEGCDSAKNDTVNLIRFKSEHSDLAIIS